MSYEDKGIDYLIEENLKLKEQSLFFLNQIELNESLTLFSSGVIWAFIATTKWNNVLNIIIWLPSLITVAFFLKRIMLSKTISALGDYFRRSEQKISELTGVEAGWESYWKIHKYEKSAMKRSYMVWWGRLFWLILFIGNTALALFFPFQEILSK